MPVGAIIDRPHPCSHYLSASHKQTVSLNLGRGGACSRPTALNEISFVWEAFRLPFCLVFAICFQTGGYRIRPYGTEQNKICRGGFHILPYYVRSFFRLRTNERLPTNSVGGDVLDAPQRCSLYLSTSTHICSQPKAPLCKGSWRGATEGLARCV